MTPQEANKNRNKTDEKGQQKPDGDRYAEGAPDSSRQFGEAGGNRGSDDRSSGYGSGQQRSGQGSGSGSSTGGGSRGSNVPPHAGGQTRKDQSGETDDACDTGCSTEVDAEEHRQVETGQRTGRPSGS